MNVGSPTTAITGSVLIDYTGTSSITFTRCTAHLGGITGPMLLFTSPCLSGSHPAFYTARKGVVESVAGKLGGYGRPTSPGYAFADGAKVVSLADLSGNNWPVRQNISTNRLFPIDGA
ncbi:MAG: hypothetical protein CME34_05280 [Gordonia sp.]|nr:hypothetical protein [Gordonia sp. (in: high G+C Gram-positive bacteria)]